MVGILGGTFDPPHYGHIAIARAALNKLRLDKIIFIPAGIPPHKMKQPVAPSVDRFNMLKLAIGDSPAFMISTIEMDRSGPSYTADTLSELRASSPGDDLYLLIGADNVAEIETWHEPKRIASLAKIAAANRPNFAPKGKYFDQVVFFTMPPTDISSTEIRNRVKAGKPISKLVSPDVERYIIKHKLYQV